jgi:hypothetical protein
MYSQALQLSTHIKATIGFFASVPVISGNEIVQSPTNASKPARAACSTGKSLRASPALYAWR